MVLCIERRGFLGEGIKKARCRVRQRAKIKALKMRLKLPRAHQKTSSLYDDVHDGPYGQQYTMAERLWRSEWLC